MSSVVFFGKAHAGKSTLAGALYARSMGIDIDREEERLRRDVPNYDPSSVYALLLDDTKQERLRRKGTTTGSTITRHYRNVTLPQGGKITVIDTPGAEHLSKERDRGMFAGDVGVFFLEAADVVNESFFVKDEQYRMIITTLALWTGLARNGVIVAFTKMDECAFSQEAYLKARDVIMDLCEGVSLRAEFLPTSIQVRERLTHNVFAPSDEMPWYTGPTLAGMLETYAAEGDSARLTNDELLFSVDQEFEQSRSRSGKTWRIKVLSGVLHKGDIITLSPVTDSNRRFLSVTGTVKSIHAELHRTDALSDLEEAGPGTIAGLDLKGLTSEKGRGIAKSDFHTIYTSCGFAAATQHAESRQFRFAVAPEHEQTFAVGREFGLMWFGRAVAFAVRSVATAGDSLHVDAELKSRPIAMPQRPDGTFVRDAILVRNMTSRNQGEFITGRLLHIAEGQGAP